MTNHKKILCKNMIFNNECKYETKCLYAHSLDEQNVNYLRKSAYDVIKSKHDLSYINLQDEPELYKVLVQLSIYCHNCVNKKCTGGYNCKYGACKYEYVICLSDLNFNNCTDKYCNKVHLSKRGLKPLKLLLDYKTDCLNNNLLVDINTYINNNDNDNTNELDSDSDTLSTSSNKILSNEILINKSIFHE